MKNMRIYPWHQNHLDRFLSSWRQNRLPTAVLWQGPIGLGQRDLGGAIAQMLLCHRPNLSEFAMQVACGHCAGCRWFLAGAHPDFVSVRPEKAQGPIKVSDVRELVLRLSNTPAQSDRHVVLIESAQAMNASAANALLKTLEEPPGSAFFLLIADQTPVIPTIRSRCQSVQWVAPPEAVTRTFLSEQAVHVDEVDWPLLMALSDGLPLRALELVQQNGLSEHQARVSQLLLLALGRATLLEVASQLSHSSLDAVMHSAWTLWLDLTRLRHGFSRECWHVRSAESCRLLAHRISDTRLFECVDQLIQSKQALMQVPLNEALCLESWLTYWKDITC